jgi:hypothetical protein
MNETYDGHGYAERERGYARAGQQSTRAGGVILAAVALLCAFLVLWGLYYATGVGARQKVALAAAECEPNSLSDNVPCTTVPKLVSEYASVTNPAIQQLNADVVAYTTAERHNLAAAETAVRAEATTADAFARDLAQFPFPAFAAPEARQTIQAIQGRVKLLTEQARSSSLVQLRSFNRRIDAAGTALQTDMKLLHAAVAHHPAPSQEP